MSKHEYPTRQEREAKTSSNRAAFPTNRELKGGLRFGPPPYPERPPKQNIYNVDRHGRAQPRGSRS